MSQHDTYPKLMTKLTKRKKLGRWDGTKKWGGKGETQGGGGRGPEEEAIRGGQEVEVRSQGKRDREQEAGPKLEVLAGQEVNCKQDAEG